MENLDLKNEKTEIETAENTPDISDELLSESEAGKIMADIKATQAIEKKQAKKVKVVKAKREKKVKKTYSLVILSCVTGILCGGAGLVGGYFLYTTLKPEVQYQAEVNDLRSVQARGDASTDLLATFENDPYNLANYAMLKFSQRRTTMQVGYTSAINFSAAQNVYSITINTKDRTYNQSISDTEPGSFIEIATAFRFYDNHDEIVTAYEYDVPSDWVPGLEPTKVYTYNEYMQTYGKLNQGLYVIDDDKNYVTSDYTQTENELISGVTIFQITKKSVKESKVTQREDGKYEVSMTLYSNRACYYSSRNIKANGRLPKNPTFQETVNATYVLDENFNLYSSFQEEDYRVTLGVEVDVTTDGTTRYFYSDTDELIVNGTKVEIPEIDEELPFFINSKGEFTE